MSEMKRSVTPVTGQEGEPVEGIFCVHHVTYLNEETGYAVVHLVSTGDPPETRCVAVGTFGEPRVGECYRIEGVWRRDPRHGMQVQVSSAVPEIPRDAAAIERYLAGASIKGLGPHYARALVQHFGSRTFEELQQGGPRLEEVTGIGAVRARTIRESWAEHQGIHGLMVNLQGIAGLTPGQAQRIYRAYGREAWMVISHDAYRLAEEVRGFGFRTCDQIARTLGMAHDAPERLQAGIVHLLERALSEGHLWSSVEHLIEEAQALLDVAPEAIGPQIEQLAGQGRAVRRDRAAGEASVAALYLPRVDRVEERVAERVAYLLRTPSQSELRLPQERATELVAGQGHADLTEEQRDALTALLAGARICILTGGPGTGKTTTVRSLVACLEALGVSYALCATTGRAGKQLAVSTGRSAATVHRHLGIGVGQREFEPLEETMLIVDEASMLDIWLLDEIAARLTERNHLFLVGDVDQLPSVGPGAVLQDLIGAAEDGQLPGLHVTRLTRIFRQEAGQRSMIVVNCHRVRAGQRPFRGGGTDSDYFEMFRDAPEQARELAVDLVARRLPKFLDVPPSEVQVLAPMHGGEAGVRALNLALQEALNPPTPGKAELSAAAPGYGARSQRVLREGDKVRQTRNNYQKRVFNGDLGVIAHIDLDRKALTVRFDDHSVAYSGEELDELVHAWALTVHSAQGSQWPAVVIVMLTSHYVMLERNILYTALSRAQRLAVMITQDQAVRVAVAQARSTRRRTGLVPRLSALSSQPAEKLRRPPHPGRLFP